MNNYCVYKHTFPNGKIYIGITSNVKKRFRNYGWDYSSQKVVFSAIQKYGWENVKHEILFENLSKKEAGQKEIELITKYKSNNFNFGYNVSTGGEFGFEGVLITEETRKKMSESAKNKLPMSEETKKKIREALKGEKNYFYGKHHSEESKRKISEARKGKNVGHFVSEKTREKISLANKGHKHTEETKQKISEKNKGKCPSREGILKSAKQKSKKVLCIENGVVYDSVTSAGRELNIDRAGIFHCLSGKIKQTHGLHFDWVK